MKKVLAFDLDDTLAISKGTIDPRMAEVLGRVLDHFQVCIISGGKYELFQQQVIQRLNIDDGKLVRLHLMPTCGTRYYRYVDGEWALQYAEDLSDEQIAKIRTELEAAAKAAGYWPESPAGEIIESRESQVTYSGLGQEAAIEDKAAWDPDRVKRMAIRDIAVKNLPGLEIRVAGSTSIDVTLEGIDKAYGMEKLIDALGIAKEDILYFGDMLQESGNDYPVKAMGIDCIEVANWEDTAGRLEAIAGALQ